MHNAARFSHAPRTSHSDAVKQIVRYLLGTRDKGLHIRPNDSRMLEVYADAEFGGSWNKAPAEHDRSTARSRIGYLITYCGVPIVHTSKLATEICLSVTEAEYCALSEALRSTIPLINLLDELVRRSLIQAPPTPTVRCTAFEDNSGALEMARVPKLRPRTKHINVKYHHFRDFVIKNIIRILPISSEDQLADFFTKQPTQELFLKFRRLTLGW